MRVIRRNLGFSLLYNVAGAAAAMSGLVGPLVAAIAMPLSSLVVVTSSISQRSFATDSPAPRPDSSPVGAPPSRPAHQPAPSS
jgi:Cu2+-exporting ATPase